MLSSTWRLSLPDVAAVNAQLEATGVPHIIACTGRDGEGSNRAVEIHTFLRDVDPATPFVILDDQPIFNNDAGPELRGMLTRHLVVIDPATGLTPEDAETAAKILSMRSSYVIHYESK